MDELRIVVAGEQAALVGELDGTQRSRLLAAFAHVRGDAMTVDLGGLTFVDSAGLRALIDLRAEHPRLQLAEPSKATQRIVRVVRPDEFLFGEAS
jgi:anti-anti-sigma regulatory factor